MAAIILAFGPIIADAIINYAIKPALSRFSLTSKRFENKLQRAQNDFIEFLKVEEFAIYLSHLLNMSFIGDIPNEDNVKQILKGTIQDKFRNERFSNAIAELKKEFQREYYYFYLVKIDDLLTRELFNELFLPKNPTVQDENIVKEILRATKSSLASFISDEIREEYQNDYLSDELNLYQKLLDDFARLNILGYRLWIRATKENKADFIKIRDKILSDYSENREKFEKNDILKKNMEKIGHIFEVFDYYIWGKIQIIEYKNKIDLDKDEVLKKIHISEEIQQQINENRNFRDAYEAILRDLNDNFNLIRNQEKSIQ